MHGTVKLNFYHMYKQVIVLIGIITLLSIVFNVISHSYGFSKHNKHDFNQYLVLLKCDVTLSVMRMIPTNFLSSNSNSV